MATRTALRWTAPFLVIAVAAALFLRGWNTTAAPTTATHAEQTPAQLDPLKTITALPTQLEMEEFPPYWVTVPADEVLPNGLRIELTAGVITGVAAEPGEPDHNILGTRYMPGNLDATDVTRALWRNLDISLKKPDGSTASIQVGRPIWWIEQLGAETRGTIDLSIGEVGIEGEATVHSIAPSDADSREGPANTNLVIGKIEHHNAEVWDLVFNGDAEDALGVTANHPLYSFDRDDWVPAGDIEIGEKIKTTDGVVTLTSKTKRPGLETVYNMEVHRSHSYYVSQFGILAHNTGISCRGLESVGNGIWKSKQGIVYGADPKFGNHVKHVLAHTVPDASKAKHSVFNIARRDVVKVVDEAWTKKIGPGTLSGRNRVCDVDMGRAIGTLGGTKMRLVFRDGTSDIITAFPVF